MEGSRGTAGMGLLERLRIAQHQSAASHLPLKTARQRSITLGWSVWLYSDTADVLTPELRGVTPGLRFSPFLGIEACAGILSALPSPTAGVCFAAVAPPSALSNHLAATAGAGSAAVASPLTSCLGVR